MAVTLVTIIISKGLLIEQLFFKYIFDLN